MAVLGLRRIFRLQRYIIALLFTSFILGMVLGITLVSNSDSKLFGLLQTTHKIQDSGKEKTVDRSAKNPTKHGSVLLNKIVPNDLVKPVGKPKNIDKSYSKNIQRPLLKVPIDKSMSDEDPKGEAKSPYPSYEIHAFYYPWYGNPEHDKKYLHWNHIYLPHWDTKEDSKWPKGQHFPPDDVGSNFYPELGPYSSRDPAVMENHMQQLHTAGVGVLAVSWYPPNSSDDNGQPWDDFMTDLLDAAHKYKLKICFHIEPYKGRNHQNMKENIKYLVRKYGQHPGFYKMYFRGRKLPLYYIYDSYLVPKEEWAKLLQPDGETTVRNTDIDGIFIGLVVEEKHRLELNYGGFDGFYTYFASDGFTFGSGTRNWYSLASYAKSNNMLFIPSVGPGYVDTRVRPWNARNSKEREHGGYYEQSFRAALAVRPPVVSITSFNEWHEGTQIERAVPKVVGRFKYQDYAPQNPNYYLMLTRKWVHKFKRQQLRKE